MATKISWEGWGDYLVIFLFLAAGKKIFIRQWLISYGSLKKPWCLCFGFPDIVCSGFNIKGWILLILTIRNGILQNKANSYGEGNTPLIIMSWNAHLWLLVLSSLSLIKYPNRVAVPQLLQHHLIKVVSVTGSEEACDSHGSVED